MTSPLRPDGWSRIRRARLVQVLGVYVGVSFGVLQAVDIFANRLPIPEWTFVAALVLLVLGLPVVIATAILQAHGAEGEGTEEAASEGRGEASGIVGGAGDAEGARGAGGAGGAGRSWLTWSRTLRGGAAVFASLVVVVVVITTLGIYGVGPAGSLIAKGVFDERERILIADFGSQSMDSALAAAVTEAFRVDFEQSTAFMLVPPAFVGEALGRMGRPPAAPLDLAVARELAQREGIKAVVAGEINSAGAGYVLSARLLSAEDGAVLSSRRETAGDATEIIEAVDRLSKFLRGRIGESLRSIRANEPLAQVSTSSLEALRRYSQAVRASDVERDADKAIALLEEAIRLDTTFAMAYRKLGVVMQNEGRPQEEVAAVLRSAYAHRDRLTDRERYLTLGTYYSSVEKDADRAMTAYRTLLDLHPDETSALNNLAVLYGERRDHEQAEALYRRAIEIDSLGAVRYTNLVAQLVPQGKFAAADSALAAYRRLLPGHPQEREFSASLAAARGDYALFDSIMRPISEQRALPAPVRAVALVQLLQVDVILGRIDDAFEKVERARELVADIGGSDLNVQVIRAYVALNVAGDAEEAARVLDRALREYPLEGVPVEERPTEYVVMIQARLGRVDLARALYDQQIASLPPEEREGALLGARAQIASAEGRHADAIRDLRRAAADADCATCLLPQLGDAYVRAGQPDSAIAVFTRYVDTPVLHRLETDSFELPRIHLALGDLHTEAGDRAAAARHYARLVELWENADPVLHPRLERARRALALSRSVP